MKMTNQLLKALCIMPFISSLSFAADATTGTSSEGGGFQMILLLVIFFGIFYFLLLRPQMKRSKEQKKMLSEITKGDEVITNGGIVGKVEKVGDSFIDVNVSGDVTIQFQKEAVVSILPKGTIKP